MKSYAIVLGGGSGKRMAAGCNKVFLPLRGVPAILTIDVWGNRAVWVAEDGETPRPDA